MQGTQEKWVQSLGWEDPLGGRNGNPLQYSCLENFMDRGAWWANSPWGCKDSDMTERTHKFSGRLRILQVRDLSCFTVTSRQ